MREKCEWVKKNGGEVDIVNVDSSVTFAAACNRNKLGAREQCIVCFSDRSSPVYFVLVRMI